MMVSTRQQIPNYMELMNPTLRAIRASGGSASNDEILNRVSEDVGLSEDAVEALHGDGPHTELSYRLTWTRTYLKSYGLLENSRRGVWSLTAAGRNTESVDPAAVARDVRNKRHSQTRGTAGDESQTLEPDAIDEQDDDSSPGAAIWQEHLLAKLKALEPDAFERLCQRILRESGFIEVEVTGKTGDGGIDGNGILRLAGLISFPVLFQCKRYAESVGASVVRDFRGAMQGRADKGLILTTGRFTQSAHKEATRDGAPPIDLIDGELLVATLKNLGMGVSVETRTVEVVTVDAQWFDSI